MINRGLDNNCEVMANEVVKVYLPKPKDDGTEFVYCDTRGSFHAFVENVNSFIGRLDMDARYFMEDGWQRYRMLWIDEDYDNVLINSDYSLNIFLKKAAVKKVYIRDINDERSGSKPGVQKKTEQQQQNAPNSASPTTPVVHEGVQCDNCYVSPIVGFRYKCAQCYDYDLCMECEHKQIHGDHAMYRFPVPLPKHTSLNHRFMKKMRHGCFGRQPEASKTHHEAGNTHHERRCGRSRRHGGGGDAFTNFYTMMFDLAEGMDTEDVENVRNTCNESRKEEAPQQQQQQQQQSTATPSQPKVTPEAPKFQMPPLDSAYASAGVQVLKNFSEMFGKLMDPLGIAVEVDIGLKNDKEAPAKPTTVEPVEKPKEPEATVEKPKEPEATVEKPKEPETVAEKSTETVESNVAETTVRSGSLISIASTSSSGVSTPTSHQLVQFDSDAASKIQPEQKPTEAKEVPESTDGATPKKDSIGVESEWTMLDHHFDNSRNTSPESSPAMPQAPTAPQTANNINYAQLSQDLLNHIHGETKYQQQQTSAATEQTKPKLPSPPVVYHSDKNINNAVIAMMAMGFSNEGNWLTNLLVTVNGNIPKALEMLHPSR